MFGHLSDFKVLQIIITPLIILPAVTYVLIFDIEVYPKYT